MTALAAKLDGRALGRNAVRRKSPADHVIFFWVIKILTTAMGEATSDFSVRAIDLVIAVGLGSIAFLVSYGVYCSCGADRYKAPVYWFAVVMVAVFGTMCADVLHVKFAVPYTVSTTGFAIILAAVFFSWNLVEHTLCRSTASSLCVVSFLIGLPCFRLLPWARRWAM